MTNVSGLGVKFAFSGFLGNSLFIGVVVWKMATMNFWHSFHPEAGFGSPPLEPTQAWNCYNWYSREEVMLCDFWNQTVVERPPCWLEYSRWSSHPSCMDSALLERVHVGAQSDSHNWIVSLWGDSQINCQSREWAVWMTSLSETPDDRSPANSGRRRDPNENHPAEPFPAF